MDKKAFFDSPEGRELFDKMQQSLKEIMLLKEKMGSSDPEERQKAIKQFQEIIEKGKQMALDFENEDPERAKRLRSLFQDPDQLTPEQSEIKEEIQSSIKQLVSHKREEGSKLKKKSKKSVQKKWTKS